MKFKQFHNTIQCNSMISLFLSANAKRCFTYYFGVRIYSSPIQRKGSRETYCFLSVCQDCGATLYPRRERGQGFNLISGKGQLSLLSQKHCQLELLSSAPFLEGKILHWPGALLSEVRAVQSMSLPCKNRVKK